MIGWIGSLGFTLFGLPQAYASYKQGHSNGITWSFLILWAIGASFSLAFVLMKPEWRQLLPLVVNYVGSLCYIVVIGRYKLWPRN